MDSARMVVRLDGWEKHASRAAKMERTASDAMKRVVCALVEIIAVHRLTGSANSGVMLDGWEKLVNRVRHI
ncbi:hypothetical protein CHS0354_040086 [Potamilus streckersoni]|uniref:Uncharacterized protein n=1 Tax=Potamilus streckersoni TaxID=2493646 RepID=A0AAE0ST76_9BIVA|nr:hypothetical protein CHS0354_040086 [Potamilus streckersoni]